MIIDNLKRTKYIQDKSIDIKNDCDAFFSMSKTIVMAADASTRLVSALLRNQNTFAPILGFPLTSTNARQLDLSVHNKELQKHPNHEDYTKTLDQINFTW